MKLARSRRAALRAALALGFALAAAATAGAGCGGKSSSSTAPPPTADVTVEILGILGANSFSPDPAAVPVGKTVAWHNGHTTTHDITANDASFDTGQIPPGETSAPITMHTGGPVAYHCSIHPTMVGSLLVGK